MTAATLLSRYEWNVGWDSDTLLEVLTGALRELGYLEEIVSHLDVIAEEEMEAYASFGTQE